MKSTGCIKVFNIGRRGRPPWKPPNLVEVEALAARGLTFKEIAQALKIHVFTLIRKRRELSEFNDAVERGRATGASLISNKLFELGLAGDETAVKFYLERRCGWGEDINVTADLSVQEREVSRREQLELYRNMTPEERHQILEITRRAQDRIKAGGRAGQSELRSRGEGDDYASIDDPAGRRRTESSPTSGRYRHMASLGRNYSIHYLHIGSKVSVTRSRRSTRYHIERAKDTTRID